jgi:glycosyltransferase involved in cell wall biosynthesis
LRDGGVEVVELPLHRLRSTPDLRVQARFALSLGPEVTAIRRLLRRREIDAVLVGGLINPHAAVAARLEGIPVVWQILDTRSPMVLRRLLMPLVTRLADVVMSTGEAVARVHPGADRKDGRLVLYAPPVDTQAFKPDASRRAAARRELGVPEDTCLIGTVGNLNPMKGHECLLEAADLIVREGADVAVRILGAFTATHADYASSLRAQARRLGLLDSGVVRFVDPGSRVGELLPAFDVFLLTSKPLSEGIPTVILEAMACGVPVVATAVGAVSEVVADGVTGFVVPPLDTAALARATLCLVRDPTLRARFGEAGRRRAVAHYDVQICARTYLHAFEAATTYRRSRVVGRMARQHGPS